VGCILDEVKGRPIYTIESINKQDKSINKQDKPL